MSDLRPYQIDGLECVIREFETVNSTIVVWATGLGKTVLAAQVVKHYHPKRTLFLANRRPLIKQARAQIEKHVGCRCEIEMAELRADRTLFGKPTVVISSVQTQYSNGGKRMFDPNEFDLLIIDECHHFNAPAFKTVVDHYRKNPNLKILGLTATPQRTDGKAMRLIFDSVAHAYELIDSVKDGWLVKPKQIFVPIGALDYSEVKTSCGDLNGKDLEAILNHEEIVQGMIQPILEITHDIAENSLKEIPITAWKEYLCAHGPPKSTIIFCKNIAQAEKFSEVLSRACPQISACVSERTSQEEHDRILKDFSTGKIRYVACVDILGEGYDNPRVEVIAMCRPTKSLVTFQQQVGRGTRTLPGTIDGIETKEDRLQAIANSGKPFLTVIDFVGNSGRHTLINCADMLGGTFDQETVQAVIKEAQKTRKPVDLAEKLEEKQAEFDEIRRQRKLAEEAKKSHLLAKTTYKSKEVDIFDIFSLKPQKLRSWERDEPPTSKQLDFLRANKIDVTNMTKKHASLAIGMTIERRKAGLCTPSQAKWLKFFNVDPTKVSFKEASSILDVKFGKKPDNTPPPPPPPPPTIDPYDDYPPPPPPEAPPGIEYTDPSEWPF